MTNDRVSAHEASVILGISRPSFHNLAIRRGWQVEKRSNRAAWYLRTDIDGEVEKRANSANDAVSAHTQMCAAIVRTYWAERGHSVRVEANGGEIESDLVNGLPR
tara:strand:+ start:6545 stop:6859 length:315 start_codon:yes stop_codon:yes gene_type:complete